MNCTRCGKTIDAGLTRCASCGAAAPVAINDDDIWTDDAPATTPRPSPRPAPSGGTARITPPASGAAANDPDRTQIAPAPAGTRRPARPARPARPQPSAAAGLANAGTPGEPTLRDQLATAFPVESAAPNRPAPAIEPEPVTTILPEDEYVSEHESDAAYYDDEYDDFAEELDDGGRLAHPWAAPVGTFLAGLGWALLQFPGREKVADTSLLGTIAGVAVIGLILAFAFNRRAGWGAVVLAGLVGVLPMLTEVVIRTLHGAMPDASPSMIAGVSYAVIVVATVLIAVAIGRSSAGAAGLVLLLGTALTAIPRLDYASSPVGNGHRFTQAALAMVLVCGLASGILQQALDRRARS